MVYDFERIDNASKHQSKAAAFAFNHAHFTRNHAKAQRKIRK
jgi:hypothetical protein